LRLEFTGCAARRMIIYLRHLARNDSSRANRGGLSLLLCIHIMYEVAFLGRNESRNTRHNIINARVLIYNPLARILRPANKDAQVSEWPAGWLPAACVCFVSELPGFASSESLSRACKEPERQRERKSSSSTTYSRMTIHACW
jgi:hypothetical protein